MEASEAEHLPLEHPDAVDAGVSVDVARVMEALAEQGVTVLFKADAKRMRDGVKPWTFGRDGLSAPSASMLP
ncbi:hypothetical protein HZZ00_18335 [Streptomyces sp. NEAU-sy36]|uniref:hypothetical protein n=1 Tax=unclassified Streptomyces TaxID=2593676 RepID=UPI0015D5A092|nr:MULTISPECIES: hypothetical protein [unclassified Streptomyces]QLI99513.1 hypothetical protein HZZ00_18335 [Streptomyces sp. NEAU-sy36]